MYINLWIKLELKSAHHKALKLTIERYLKPTCQGPIVESKFSLSFRSNTILLVDTGAEVAEC